VQATRASVAIVAGVIALAVAVGAVTFTGQDPGGNPLDTLYAILGYSRRYHVWAMLGYGTNDVSCDRPAALFGGRRKAILKDLGVPCHP
jgi:hypothetical protein